MNTRQTFNGKVPKRKPRLSNTIMVGVIIVLTAVTVAAWIGVAGLYISDDVGGRHAVKGNDFKHSQGIEVGLSTDYTLEEVTP